MSIEQKINELEKRLNELEEKQKKRKRAENNAKVELEIVKQDFLELNPKGNVILSPQELALYAAMLFNENNPNIKDRITSFGELGKRTKKIKHLVEYFLEIKNDPDWAKMRVKYWIEYIYTVVKGYKDFRTGNFEILTFYQLVSDWALKEFATGFIGYCKNKQFQNLPELEEDDL